MGKVLSLVPRQLKQFNIENRAHKVISKDKPTPAPKYPATIEELERIAKG
jgi:NADH dehydrogenase [ubiquinone] 1 alpha subcomplex assembly factor 4